MKFSSLMAPEHDDVIKWKHFPRYWPFVRGIHWSPVNSPHKGEWRSALVFSLICIWINSSANNREAGDLRRHRSRYNLTVMSLSKWHLLVTKIPSKRWHFHFRAANHILVYMKYEKIQSQMIFRELDRRNGEKHHSVSVLSKSLPLQRPKHPAVILHWYTWSPVSNSLTQNGMTIWVMWVSSGYFTQSCLGFL